MLVLPTGLAARLKGRLHKSLAINALLKPVCAEIQALFREVSPLRTLLNLSAQRAAPSVFAGLLSEVLSALHDDFVGEVN